MNYHFGWRGISISIYRYGDFPLHSLAIEINDSCVDWIDTPLFDAVKQWADYYTVNGRAWANMEVKDFLDDILGEGVPLQTGNPSALDPPKSP